jgi:hypothetical protein
VQVASAFRWPDVDTMKEEKGDDRAVFYETIMESPTHIPMMKGGFELDLRALTVAFANFMCQYPIENDSEICFEPNL